MHKSTYVCNREGIQSITKIIGGISLLFVVLGCNMTNNERVRENIAGYGFLVFAGSMVVNRKLGTYESVEYN